MAGELLYFSQMGQQCALLLDPASGCMTALVLQLIELHKCLVGFSFPTSAPWRSSGQRWPSGKMSALVLLPRIILEQESPVVQTHPTHSVLLCVARNHDIQMVHFKSFTSLVVFRKRTSSTQS